MKYTSHLALLASILCSTSTLGAAVPTIKQFKSGVQISAMSDNGRWALSNTVSEREDGTNFGSGGAIWNLETMTSAAVHPNKTGFASVSDVTDDGQLIAGSCAGKPAIYNVATASWTILPIPSGTVSGTLMCITPDGRRAAGHVNRQDEWDAIPVLYDLTTNELIELKGVPTTNMNLEQATYSDFCGISADGRYLLGRLSQEILMPVSMCAYVYDTQSASVKYIGFTPTAKPGWKADYAPTLFIDMAQMSPDGKYVTGSAYITKAKEGSEWSEEYYVAYRFNTESGKTEVFDGVYDQNIASFATDNAGNVLAASPHDSPVATMLIRQGNYYYSLEDIFTQTYNTNFYQSTGYSCSGKPSFASTDGKTIISYASTQDCYLLQMTDSWADAIAHVNLLGNYASQPAASSVMSAISEVKLAFARNVDMAGSASQITLRDASGNLLRSASKAEAKENVVTINFRTTKLEADQHYTLNIPAGLISMVGDMSVACNAISIPFVGRADGAVALTATLPASGNAMSHIDSSSNPIYLTFNASLKIADGAVAQIWRKGESEPYAQLSLNLYNANTLMLYPVQRLNLYEGTDYEVVLPAGSVTDLGGFGGNEEVRLNYSGTYVRPVSSDDKVLFHDNCDNYSGFLFYDGDHRTPSGTPASWGFKADLPWLIVASTEQSSDMALAAHSMYSPAGKADDWMSTPQIYIPDDLCYLSFEAQSYRKNNTDRLKIYAWTSPNVYSTLTADIVESMRKEGTLIFDEQLLPGSSEEELEGDWQTFNIPLADFAGKNLYLAFVNDNDAQSAVFINKVDVIHDMQFLASVNSPLTVVNRAEQTISGAITMASPLLTAERIDLRLLNAEGVEVSKVTAEGLNLQQGQAYSFTFPTPLPLKSAIANDFTIDIMINSEVHSSLKSSIKNLTFQPVHRLLVEEYSGRECPNCPGGFLAMDNLERIYPNRVLPVVIRTYQSDPLGYGLETYSQFLGLDNMGAPSAIINRTYACYPMVVEGNDFRFSAEGLEDGSYTWLDAAARVLALPTDCDLSLQASLNEAGRIEIAGNAKWAINTPHLNANLLTIITEDACETLQINNLYSYSDPDLGEWGAGGIYGSQVVSMKLDNVARAAYGLTYNGTPGLLPTAPEADIDYPFSLDVALPSSVSNNANVKVIVALINADSGSLINAASVKLIDNSDIEQVDIEQGAMLYFDLQGRRVATPSAGQLLLQRREGSFEAKKVRF